MALSILDGNQSATTLSTIVTSGQHIPAHTVVSLGTQAISNITSAVSGTSVTFGLVGGTVTANNFTLTNVLQYDGSHYFLKVGGVATTGGTSFPVYVAGSVTLGASTAQIGSVTVGNSVTIGSALFSKSTGAVSMPTQAVLIGFGYDSNQNFVGVNDESPLPVYVVQALPAGTNRIGVVTIGGGTVTIGAGTVTIGAGTAQIGSVTASISNSLTIGSLPAISGTVTANSSNGSLTTRFGSVTTANTAFATSAVTNSNRKYLLIQNVTTASNVITVGIGFTPTTTQGIQLFSGAGLTFEGSYIPTGAVNLLSSVTASCFTILEA